MRVRNKIIFINLLCLTVVLGIYSYPALANEITIVGEVNDAYQVVTDDHVYDVAPTEKGYDLIINHIADKVEVTGTVEEKEDMIIITVKSFRVVPE
jgi:hypothetical protein